MRHITRIAFLLCCLPALMGAEIYRWVDANGVVNYTQQKPLGIPSERVVTGSAGTRRATDQSAAPATAPAQEAEQNTALSPAQQDALDALRAAETARQTELTNVLRTRTRGAGAPVRARPHPGARRQRQRAHDGRGRAPDAHRRGPARRGRELQRKLRLKATVARPAWRTARSGRRRGRHDDVNRSADRPRY